MHDGRYQAMNDARPVHHVHVKGFYMDESEVTNDEFAAFVKAAMHQPVLHTIHAGHRRKGNTVQHPIM